MKRNYQGLFTRRISVSGQPLMQFSNQKIEGKTKTNNWKAEDITVEEFGMSDIGVTDITSTP
ncbi:MAG: hypothetical protein J6W75_12550 [Bacteroidaceae bacterium]|nr:hypothetical protein [Bacteroidales bacterium]MBP5772154.1 hypothetical protein [Bacteroidaceae bacterium]